MKNLIFIAIFSLLTVLGYGQVEFEGALPIGTYSASQSGGGSGFWTLSGSFTDQTGQTDAGDVQVGDFVCFTDGDYTFFLPITEIVFASAPSLIVKVNNTGVTQISSVGSGNKGIYRGNSAGLFPFISGLSNADQQAVMSYNMKLIADQLANASSCELTLTKTAHGFPPFTPLVFNGSTYVRPTNDTIIPDYIVTDSLTANTFKVSSCGTYNTILPNGVYWYTSASPGYSLVQDTIKVPLFSVVDGKLTLRPLVGFNLGATGGSSGPSGIYGGSDSLSQENTYAAMAADGSQNFGIGYLPEFPNLGYIGNDNGLLISKNNWGGNILMSSDSSGGGYRWSTHETYPHLSFIGNEHGEIGGQGAYRSHMRFSKGYTELIVFGNNQIDKFWRVIIDTSKFEITRNIAGTGRTYELLPSSQYPSTTSGVTNILKWTAGVPSFGLVPNLSNEDQTIASGQRYIYYGNDHGSYHYYGVDTVNGIFDEYSYLAVPGASSILYNWAYRSAGQYSYYAGSGPYVGNAFGAGYPSAVNVAEKYHSSIYNITASVTTASSSTSNESKAMIQTLSDSTLNSTGVLMSIMGVGYNKVHYTGIVRGEVYSAQASSTGSNSPNNRYFYNDANINFHIQTANTVGVGGKYNWFSIKNLDDGTAGRAAISMYNDSYTFANATPSATAGAISTHIWTAGTPSFLRSQHKVVSGTTDGSGDLLVTFDAAMPDITYTMFTQTEGDTYFTTVVRTSTKATGSVKVRFFDAAGVALASTTVQISYEVKDSN